MRSLDALSPPWGQTGCGELLMNMGGFESWILCYSVTFSSLSPGLLTGKLRPDNNPCLLASQGWWKETVERIAPSWGMSTCPSGPADGAIVAPGSQPQVSLHWFHVPAPLPASSWMGTFVVCGQTWSRVLIKNQNFGTNRPGLN